MNSTSVVIPCLNVAGTVATAISSARSQFESDIDGEVICVDDGSTDSTLELLSELAADGQIILLRHASTCGAAVARNRGLRAARGDYIQFLDADDILSAGKLRRQIQQLSESGADFVAGAYESRHMDGRWSTRYPDTDIWAGLLASELGKTSANLFRTRSLLEVNGWSETQESSQEYELMFRLLRHRGANGPPPVVDRKVSARVISTAGSISNRDTAANAVRFIQLRRQMLDYLKRENLLTAYRAQCCETACEWSRRFLSDENREMLGLP